MRSVWQGFWRENQSFLLIESTPSALLVKSSAIPDGYRAIDSRVLPSELRGKAYRHEGYPRGISSNGFAPLYALTERDTIPAMPALGGSIFGKLDFIYHESFHGFQERTFAPVAGEPRGTQFAKPSVSDPRAASAEFAAAAEKERHMLVSALLSAPLEKGKGLDRVTRGIVRSYLEARTARLAGSEQIIAMERMRERREGTATYVGLHGAALALDSGAKVVRARIISELQKDLGEMANMPESDARIMRWRLYGTGAAIAYLLDRVGVDWKPLVASGGSSLDLLLGEAVGLGAAEAQRH